MAGLLENATRLQQQADAEKVRARSSNHSRQHSTTSQERALESLLFSDLHADDQPDDDDNDTPSAADYWIDRGQEPSTPAQPSNKRKPAWDDPDDATLQVPIARAARLRKLRQHREEMAVAGDEYERRLRQQHAKLHPRTAWADLDRTQGPEEALEGLEPSSQALVRRAGGLVARSSTLPPGLLEISRLKDANAASPSDAVVRAARFHPQGRLLMTAGLDKRLKFFKVDGVKNELVQSLFLEDLPIHTAHWGGGGQFVVAAGRRKHLYVFDLAHQRCERVQGCLGTQERSYESFVVSQDEQRPCAAFLGDAGHVQLVSLTSRQPIGTLAQSGSVRSAAFSADGSMLYTCGGDGVLHTWDLRTRRCMARGIDEGCLNSTALAASSDGALLAAASTSGVVNLYDPGTLRWAPPGAPGPRAPPRLTPAKSLMHHTTLVDTLAFSPTSELLVFGSRMQRDALKLLHVPSRTVFSNWPTSRSLLGYVHCADVSPRGGLLAIGNAKGRVLLYRLHHYQEA